jgi:hypothetical protein
VPQDIPLASHAKNNPVGGESPKVDKPLSPSTKKSESEKAKPPVQEMLRVPLVLRVLSLLQPPPTQDVTRLMIRPSRIRPNTQEHPCRTPNRMDSGLLVVVNPVNIHPYPSLKSNRDNIRVS